MSRLDHINLENKVDALAARVRKIEEMLAAIMTDGEPAALEGERIAAPPAKEIIRTGHRIRSGSAA